MRRPLLLSTLAVSLSLGGLAGGADARSRAPVVVELFTAQGCAACPPADRMLGEIAARKGVLALTLPVDIWDYVGWADTLAQPGFTDRQRAYDKRLKVREIYTPEIVVDGARETPAMDKDAVDALIQDASHVRSDGAHLTLLRGAGKVRIDGRPKQDLAHLDVWLIRYDPREQDVRVKAGDNKGKLVVQRNVVRELTRLGGYAGRTRTYKLPAASAEGLSTVVLLQGAKGGPIMAIAQG